MKVTVLSVNSGDTVTPHSFPAGGKGNLGGQICGWCQDYISAIETLPHTDPVRNLKSRFGGALQFPCALDALGAVFL